MIPNPQTNPAYYKNIPTKRFLAWITDGIISFIFTVLIVIFTLGLALWLFFFLWVVIDFVTRVTSLAIRGYTPGMRFVGLRIMTKSGENLSLGRATLHVLGTSIVLSSMLWILSGLCILYSQYRQSLVDMVLGTVILPKPARQ